MTITNKQIILTLGIGLAAASVIYTIRYFATRPRKTDGTTEPEVTIGNALGNLYNDLFGDKKAPVNNYTDQKNAIANDMLYGGLSEAEMRRANELTNKDDNNDCLLDGTENKEYTDTRTGKKYKGLPTQKCIGEALTKGMDVRTYIAQR